MADNDWWFDLKTKTPVQDSKARRSQRSAQSISDSRGGRAGTGKVEERNEACDPLERLTMIPGSMDLRMRAATLRRKLSHSPASRLPPGGFVTLDPTTVATRTVEVGCDFVHQSAFDVATVFQVEPVGDQPAEMISSSWSFEPDIPNRTYSDLYGNPCRRLMITSAAA